MDELFLDEPIDFAARNPDIWTALLGRTISGVGLTAEELPSEYLAGQLGRSARNWLFSL